MHGYFVRWLSIQLVDLKNEICGKTRLVQECLQLLGYSRTKLERNQIPTNELAKQMWNNHRIMLTHQRLSRSTQSSTEQTRNVSTSVGVRNRSSWCMTRVIRSSHGAHQSLVTEASTVERRQTGSQKNSFRGDTNAPALVERLSMWLSSVKLFDFRNLKLRAQVWLYVTQLIFF